MLNIAVIIPFYQEQAGILGRALESVFAQALPEPAHIRVLVVDDGSPADPGEDASAMGALPAHVTVEVIRRPNGGPAAARNTGLEALGDDVDYVALLDSDDAWRPGHLARALEGLRAGCDVYFADHHMEGDPGPYLPTTQFFRKARDEDGFVAPIAEGSALLTCVQGALAEHLTREYLAHTSSIVYRRERLGGVRWAETLRAAGEDTLFFLDLALAADSVCFSFEVDVSKGRGVSIYDSALEWGTPADLRRRTYNVAALKLMRERAEWSEAAAEALDRRIVQERRTVGYLLARHLLMRRGAAVEAVRLAWRIDRKTVQMAPVNLMVITAQRLIGGAPLRDDGGRAAG